MVISFKGGTHRHRFLLPIVFAINIMTLFAQPDSLVNSGAVISRAKVLSDSGKYELAIRELARIEPRDTNYVLALLRLADLYYSNGEYDEAIKKSVVGLKHTSSYRSEFLVTQGMAYTQLGDYGNARAVFDTGLAEYPFYPAFVLQKGRMCYLEKKYDEAEALFFRGLEISPFNTISHLYLGIISILRGEKTRAMMAMGIYLAINNQNNSQLVSLERFVKNQLTDESIIPPSGANPFARLDGIIRSRIAMEQEYKTRIPIDAGIVRQFQLMFDQLGAHEYDADGTWTKFYLPLYRAIKQANAHDAFVYHILKSSSISTVKEWTQKNNAALEKFYSTINMSLRKWREMKTLPWLGYQSDVHTWYGDNSRLEAIGNKDKNDDEVGLWYYYHTNGALKATGVYDNGGQKQGVWKYFNDFGNLTAVEDYASGHYKRYTKEGKLWQTYSLVNGKVEGEVLIYRECGTLLERLVYKAGQRHGNGEIYSISGQVVERYGYLQDSLHGKYETFFENGSKQIVANYERGKFHGAYIRYHRNGKVRLTGNYLHGKASGNFIFYHDNGNLNEEGSYKDDLLYGVYKIYDRSGKLIEVRHYGNDEELTGEQLFYYDDKVHYKLVYSDNRITEVVYYDLKGNLVERFAEENGVLGGRGFYPDGRLRSEFEYSKGEPSGVWNYYYHSGALESTNEYLNGNLHGQVIDYHPNKSIKSKIHYENGNKHGPYESFFSNGKIESQGWYQSDMTQGRWLFYHPTGNIKSDEYYLNDELTGESYYYSLEGKLFQKIKFTDSKITELINYNETGDQVSRSIEENDQISVTLNYLSGRPQQQLMVKCGKLHGDYLIFFPDGKEFLARQYDYGEYSGVYKRFNLLGALESKGTYVEGSAEGERIWYFPDGSIEIIGNYANDKRDSLWKYYYEKGKLSSEVNYVDGERDGVSKHYSFDGILILEKKYMRGNLIAYRSLIGKSNDWVEFSGTGTIRAVHPNGKLALEESYKDGLLHGSIKSYFSNGQLQSLKNYQYGDYDGLQTYYYPDGKVKLKEFYILDDAHGRWERFDPSGRIESVMSFSHGYPQGVAEQYSQGKKIKSVKFYYGFPIE